MPSKSSLFSIILPIVPFVLPLPAQAFLPEHLAQLLKTNQCPNCDLSGANLEKANLSNANLIGANLQNATLTGANLSNANLEGASLKGASLNDVYLYRANLTGTNFSSASLQNTHLRETTLVGTNFSSADLRSADLQATHLAQALFPGANLSGANLSNTIGAVAINVRTGVRTSSLAEFVSPLICLSSPETDYPPTLEDLNRSAKSMGFKVQTADFAGVNFSGVNLQNALLMNANLRQVDLTGANLRSSCLIAVNLTEAKLDRADLTNSQLVATDLPVGISNKTITAVPSRAARRSFLEARTYIGSMNRAQQAYYLENSRFTTDSDALGFGKLPENPTYKYRLFLAPNRYPAVMNVALSQRDDLQTFVGLVTVGTFTQGSSKGESVTLATFCVSDKPATPLPLWSAIDYQPKNPTDPIACPSGFTLIK